MAPRNTFQARLHEFDTLTRQIETLTEKRFIFDNVILSQASLSLLSSLAMYIRDKISLATPNFGKESRHTRLRYHICGPKEIQTAVKATLPTGLADYAVMEGI
jgi:hypothetical protein